MKIAVGLLLSLLACTDSYADLIEQPDFSKVGCKKDKPLRILSGEPLATTVKDIYCNYLLTHEGSLMIVKKDGSKQKMDAFAEKCSANNYSKDKNKRKEKYESCQKEFISYSQLGTINLVPPSFEGIKNLTSDCYEKNLSYETIVKCANQKSNLKDLIVDIKPAAQTCEEVTEQYAICNGNKYVRQNNDDQSVLRIQKRIEQEIKKGNDKAGKVISK